jgi:hypothetical protein
VLVTQEIRLKVIFLEIFIDLTVLSASPQNPMLTANLSKRIFIIRLYITILARVSNSVSGENKPPTHELLESLVFSLRVFELECEAMYP